jgi:hypothetical protein
VQDVTHQPLRCLIRITLSLPNFVRVRRHQCQRQCQRTPAPSVASRLARVAQSSKMSGVGRSSGLTSGLRSPKVVGSNPAARISYVSRSDTRRAVVPAILAARQSSGRPVIILPEERVTALHAVFDGTEFYVPPVEVIAVEAHRPLYGHFNIIHTTTALKADIYTIGADHLHHWAIDRRRATTIDDETVWLAPPEYVALRKLQYFRDGGSDKHLRDVRAMLRQLAISHRYFLSSRFQLFGATHVVSPIPPSSRNQFATVIIRRASFSAS